MGKILNQVSCLIKAREYNVGFPNKFSHYPVNMDSERMDKIHTLVLEAMQDPGSISGSDGRVRRIVIGDGKYMVLGISGYLSSIMQDLSDGYNSFCDLSGTRKAYGFAGFVWDLTEYVELPQDFPAITEFAELFKAEILPHWKDSANSIWAENVKRGITVPYCCKVNCGEDDIPNNMMGNRINTNKHKVAVFRSEGALLIREAIFWASKRHEVSLCTDLDYYEESGTDFMNLCSYRFKEDKRLYDNIRNNMRGVKKNEQKMQKAVNVRENTGLGTKYVDERAEKSNEQDNNLQESIEKIRVTIIFIIRVDEREAKKDYDDLRKLMKECIHRVNGKFVSYGNPPPTSRLKQVVKVLCRSSCIICEVDCPSSDDIEKLLFDLSEKIRKKKNNGYLYTVERVNYHINQGCGDRKASGSIKKATRSRVSRNDSKDINDKNDESIDSIEQSTEQLTEQLTELYGNRWGKSSPKRNNTSSNSDNPFLL